MKKALLALLVLVVVLAGAGAGGGAWYLRTATPQREGAIQLSGITAPVEIWRDSLGVPHVFAAAELDLLFAQGFVHAQDRLWQMDLLRRAGEGRLAELFGERMIETDRFLRVLGMRTAARRDEAAASPESLARLDAYAAGVNAYLETRRGALPPEYLVIRAEPERWTRVHSLVIGHVMSFDLSAYTGESGMVRAAQRLDSAQLAALAPFYPEWGPTILEAGDAPMPAPAAAVLDASSITRASNAWVVGGARTRSGKPILANDMHLALRAPSLWYLMALHAEAFDVAGMSLPGVPYIIAGHNRAVAWGFTNAMLDDVDLFLERVDPTDSTRYLVPGGSAAFEVVSDTIVVKGRAQPEVFQYRRTRHGPVVTDVADELGPAPLALRWVVQDPAASLEAVRSLNLAHDWSTFRAAVAGFDNPHQNVVFADTAGDFGYAMGGRIPLRGDGTRAPPVLPVPGWTGQWDWNGYLPDSAHPAVLNPAHGYVVTANNRQAAGALAARISTEWETPFRAARIRELVLASHDLTAADVHAMQLDVHDAHAQRYRERAIAAARAAGLGAEAQTLAEWNLAAEAGSRAAALYYAWVNRLPLQLARTLYGDTLGFMPRRVADAALENGALPWVSGSAGRAAFDTAAAAAMREARSVVGARTWGALQSVRAEHALGTVPALRTVLHLNVGEEPAAGSETTINVRHFRGAQFPATASYGPSQRHVVDMADMDGSGGFILPTGQSGLPFEKQYRDQFDRWQNGGLWRIPLTREAADARTVHRLRLEPRG